MSVLGIPSAVSRFSAAAAEVLERVLGPRPIRDPRALTYDVAGIRIVEARGRDLPRLVGLGVIDAALSGFDTFVEARLQGYEVEALRTISSRPTQLALIAPERRDPTAVARIFSEYPVTTDAWLARHPPPRPAVVAMRGSLEGLVRTDDDSAGVTTVTTGATAAANGLQVCATLLDSDLCLITRPGDTTWATQFAPMPLSAAALPDWAR